MKEQFCQHLVLQESCAHGKQWQVRHLPFCLLGNGLLQRNVLPRRLQWDSDIPQHIYLWQGQTQTLQIPFLCLINDWLNYFVPLINENKLLVIETMVSFLLPPGFWPWMHLQAEPAYTLSWKQAVFMLKYSDLLPYQDTYSPSFLIFHLPSQCIPPNKRKSSLANCSPVCRAHDRKTLLISESFPPIVLSLFLQ